MRSASSSWINNNIVYNCCYFLIIILSANNFYSLTPTAAQPPPSDATNTANISTTWTLSDTDHSHYHIDTFGNVSGTFNLILLTEPEVYIKPYPRFTLGFFCQGDASSCTSHLLAIFILSEGTPSPLVWSANRDYLVKNNAILNFTAAGELVLRDADGTMVWTTNTAGKSVIGMNFTDTGNLVLYDVSNQVVWQSFDHPTDCLLPGQKLYQGQKLISSTSWTSDQKGIYSLQVTDEGLFAYIESTPPQAYFSRILFLNGSLSLYFHSAKPSDPDYVISIPRASSAQFMKLMPDGHLKVFEWQLDDWKQVDDLLTLPYLGECGYPLACGRNAICLNNKQCTCLVSNSLGIEYFRPVNSREPNLGCSENTPLTCNATKDQYFIAVENVTYFTFTANLENVDMETCKQACLKNCSCKAALYWRKRNNDSSSSLYNNSGGDCYLPSDLFTVTTDSSLFNPYKFFVKVQNASASSLSTSPNPFVSPNPFASQKRKNRVAKVLGPAIGISLIVVVGFVMFIVHKKRQYIETEEEEEYIDQVPGMPTRFSYGELKAATENFSKKLGEGGFGTVFEGILEDGTKIAVKCLEGLGQVNKSFLAEVESIGSIHHVNLVRLRGYSAWKSRRLLVYDFMSNGSLDRWIYHGDLGHILEWECRKNIIFHIAKGLAYLHEDCRQQIIHLDIKPQNILLDDNFNAKVSDFGLSKLVDKNQTQVMTTIKGTPGYIAPECWSSSIITEKVDVYSFGIVVLEILCGRKNFDRSLPEESWHLLGVFQKSWEQGSWLDMVDKYSEDMQANGAEVVEMMKVASWCLQTEFTRRPSMSSVLKVLEGGMSVESNLDYNFTDPRMQKTAIAQEKELTELMPSIISGPR